MQVGDTVYLATNPFLAGGVTAGATNTGEAPTGNGPADRRR